MKTDIISIYFKSLCRINRLAVLVGRYIFYVANAHQTIILAMANTQCIPGHYFNHVCRRLALCSLRNYNKLLNGFVLCKLRTYIYKWLEDKSIRCQGGVSISTNTLIRPARQCKSTLRGMIPLFSWSLTYSSWLLSALILKIPSAFKAQ